MPNLLATIDQVAASGVIDCCDVPLRGYSSVTLRPKQGDDDICKIYFPARPVGSVHGTSLSVHSNVGAPPPKGNACAVVGVYRYLIRFAGAAVRGALGRPYHAPVQLPRRRDALAGKPILHPQPFTTRIKGVTETRGPIRSIRNYRPPSRTKQAHAPVRKIRRRRYLYLETRQVRSLISERERRRSIRTDRRPAGRRHRRHRPARQRYVIRGADYLERPVAVLTLHPPVERPRVPP